MMPLCLACSAACPRHAVKHRFEVILIHLISALVPFALMVLRSNVYCVHPEYAKDVDLLCIRLTIHIIKARLRFSSSR